MMTRTVATALILIFAACSSVRVPLVDDDDHHSQNAQRDNETGSMGYTGQDAKEEQKSRDSLLIQVGQRSFSDDGWDTLDDHLSLNVELSWLHTDWIFGWEVGLGVSRETNDLDGFLETLTGTMVEFYSGPRFERSIGDGPFRYYLGAGPSLVYADMQITRSDQSKFTDDLQVGLYIHGGMIIDFDQLCAGVDFRTLLGTDMTTRSYQNDLNYSQISLVFGWHW